MEAEEEEGAGTEEWLEGGCALDAPALLAAPCLNDDVAAAAAFTVSDAGREKRGEAFAAVASDDDAVETRGDGLVIPFGLAAVAAGEAEGEVSGEKVSEE